MKLGFVSAVLPELSLEEVLDFAAKAGFDCVELMCWPKGKAERRYAGVTHIDMEGFDQAAAADVKALCEDKGVEISALGYYPNPLTPDVDEATVAIAQIRKVIAASALLGVNHANTFVGRDWTKSVEDNWPRFMEVFPPLIAYAEELGVYVGIENCPMFFTGDEWPGGKNLAKSPSIWKQMFEAIPSANWGLNYDPSHLVLQMMDYLTPMREFSDRLMHVHAKDLRIDIDKLNQVGVFAHPAEWHSPKLPGLGDIDWGKFFSVLSDTGYDGPVCIEAEDRAYEGSLERRKKGLIQAAGFLRGYIA